MLAVLLGFGLAFVGSIPLAGPVSVLVFQRGVLARYRDGFALAVGAALSESLYSALAVSGFGLLLARYPLVEPVARGMGLLVLLVLGSYLAVSKQAAPAEAVPQARAGTESWGKQFSLGLSVSGFNPTLLLSWSASVAMIYSVGGITFGPMEKALFVLGVGLGIVAWFRLLLTLIERHRSRFPFQALQQSTRVLGVVLLLVGLVSGYRWLTG